MEADSVREIGKTNRELTGRTEVGMPTMAAGLLDGVLTRNRIQKPWGNNDSRPKVGSLMNQSCGSDKSTLEELCIV